MSQNNPYLSSVQVPIASAADWADSLAIRKVKVRPIDLFRRGYSLISGQYWLFFGITVMGLLVGSAVPMGILLGPMMVGIYLCYGERDRGEPAKFETLFKGLDDFVNSFVAAMILMAASLFAMLPFLIALFALVIIPIINAQAAGGNINAPPPTIPLFAIVLYPIMIGVNLLVTMPFLFAFQLIADRKLKALAAIKASIRGVLRNWSGVLVFMLVLATVGLVLTLMCYLPVLFFLPISFGAMFVLYRDIFPRVA